MEEEDYVCPMNLEAPLAVQGMRDGLQNGTKGSNYRIEVRGADKVHKQEDEVITIYLYLCITWVFWEELGFGRVVYGLMRGIRVVWRF